MKKEIIIQETVKLGGVAVKIPMTPNFIIREFGNGLSIPIQHFTNAELRQMGKLWVENLIKSANKKRKS